MRISDWSSDVCSSDLCKLRNRKNRSKPMTDSRSTTLNLPQEIGEVIRDVLEKHNPEWADEFAFTLAVCVLEGNIHTVSNLCPQHQAHMLALGSAAIQDRKSTRLNSSH